MELDAYWTCGCGAVNASDVFSGVCWKCGVDWSDGPLKVQTAEELQMCPDCRATDGFHKVDCPTAKWPWRDQKK